MRKKAIVTVINDLSTDQRVARICRTLNEEGYEILLLGRVLKKSPSLPDRPYRMKRMRLPFEKGPLFYLSFALSSFFILMREKADLIWANDLDTLVSAYPASRLKKIPLIYDSHEYFTEVPELQGRSFKKRIWERSERWILPKLPFMITVNPSIAQVYEKKYGIPVHVVPNHPERENGPNPPSLPSREALGLPEDRFILVLQGSGINPGRGGDEALEAMERLDDRFLLLIIGGGDRIGELHRKAEAEGMDERIRFLPRMPYEEMMQYTRNADLGLSLDKPISENYRLSSPNKLFDYIRAGIPILASEKLPEVERIVRENGVGSLCDPSDPKAIAAEVERLHEHPEELEAYRKNCRKAREEFVWERTGAPVLRKCLKEVEAHG